MGGVGGVTEAGPLVAVLAPAAIPGGGTGLRHVLLRGWGVKGNRRVRVRGGRKGKGGDVLGLGLKG